MNTEEPSVAVVKKADGYLTSGRVKVIRVDVAEHQATLHVEGSTRYVVRYNAGWSCDCPARVSRCAHVVAAQKVVELHDEMPKLPSDPELAALLGPRVPQVSSSRSHDEAADLLL